MFKSEDKSITAAFNLGVMVAVGRVVVRTCEELPEPQRTDEKNRTLWEAIDRLKETLSAVEADLKA